MSSTVRTSRGHFGVAIVACILSLLAPVHPSAQSSNASIVGRVADESGAVLPGVTVTATSPALQVPSVSTITDVNGDYRISPLPIGLYNVTYELSGFESIRREEVRLTVGFVARLDTTMKVGTLSETITVSGASPVVDTVTTAATTQLTREQLETIPGSRNGLISLLASAPGVRTTKEVGGSATNEQAQFRAFGQSGEAWNLIEGVFSNAPQAGGGAGNYFDFNSFDESAISTLGNPAKTPTRGIQILSLVKSGGNQTHGQVTFGEYLTNWQGNNLDAALQAQGVTSGNPTKIRYDRGGDISGKIIKDKLWYYTALRRRFDVREIAGAFKTNGREAAVDSNPIWWHTVKTSYQMTPSNKLVFFHQYTDKWESDGADTLTAWESRGEQQTVQGIGKIEWQAVKGQTLVFDLQTGYWQYYAKRYGINRGPQAQPDNELPGISMTDAITQMTSGENTGVGVRTRQGRKHTRGNVAWYLPNSFAGNHTIDTGFDFLHQYASRGAVARNQPPYQLEFQSGVPFQLRTQNTPVSPLQHDNYLGIYAQDTWTVARRFTMNLGVRFAHDDASVPESCRLAAMFAPAQCWDKIQLNVWNTLAPRLHAAYDITGDGKTVAKFGWGRFIHMRSLEPEVRDLDPKSTQVTIWRWSDRNGDKLYQPGEVNLDPNGPDFVSGASGSTFVVNPDEVPPTTDEFSASLERQLIANLAVRATGIHSRNHNTLRVTNLRRPASAYNIPITRPDPGPDGRVGSADDPGTSLTYWEYAPALAGAAFESFMRVNDPRADTHYTSLELAAVKRSSRGYQFSTSYSATKIDGDLGPNNAFGPADNPNAEINAAAHYWEWQAKLSGSYELPFGVTAAANYELRSGDVYARTVRLTGGRTISNFTLPVEARDARRLPKHKLFDVRASKTVNLWKQQRVELQLNIYNVLNANTVQAVQTRSGATFGLPVAAGGVTILPPRIVQVGATFRF
jgi:hypothetical protein